jgi:hypothetical protein
MRRRDFIAGLGLGAAWPLVTRAQEQVPRIVFSPALDVPQGFRVSYRFRQAPTSSPTAATDFLAIKYRLTVTTITRENDGYRMRLLVSGIEWPSGRQKGSMDMVVAAMLMLEGLPIEMSVDGRGFLKEVRDWPNLQGALGGRIDVLLDDGYGSRSIGHSVIDDRNAAQVADYLAPAIEAMNYARSYFDFAKQTGASTISWYGSPFDMTIAPANNDGTVMMTWRAPSGARGHPTNEGSATFRRDGFTARLKMTRTDLVFARQKITEIEALDGS